MFLFQQATNVNIGYSSTRLANGKAAHKIINNTILIRFYFVPMSLELQENALQEACIERTPSKQKEQQEQQLHLLLGGQKASKNSAQVLASQ